jgi:hypothetical protein
MNREGLIPFPYKKEMIKVYSRYKTLTKKEAHARGWCKVCKKPCIKFDPVDFVEFAGRRGIDALIIERDGRMAFLLAPMPNRKFRILMQEYIKERMEVE